jgi:16S rRNA (guanine527-N7)-methyltransferase
MGALTLTAPEINQLVEGAARLGVVLPPDARERLRAFAALLNIWNRRFNLVSCASASQLVDRHLLDSLTVNPLLDGASTIVDLGSGAGFPGVPLSIIHPETVVALVEPRRRRANFLREVRRTLRLENLRVVDRRAEEGPSGREKFDAAVCRAVWSDGTLIAVAILWLRVGGTLLWMRGGTRQRSSMIAVKDSQEMRFVRRSTYRIGSHVERFIDVFRRVPRATSK